MHSEEGVLVGSGKQASGWIWAHGGSFSLNTLLSCPSNPNSKSVCPFGVFQAVDHLWGVLELI
jgi:hypothetical protein